jgi:hypothetical protein
MDATRARRRRGTPGWRAVCGDSAERPRPPALSAPTVCRQVVRHVLAEDGPACCSPAGVLGAVRALTETAGLTEGVQAVDANDQLW